MNNIIKLTEQYFKCFIEKDIKGLRELYDENVTLKDWDVQSVGIENMIRSNTSLFLLNYNLVINKISVSENVSFNSITIDFGNEKIEVLDVIEFNNDKIVSVRAYKG